MKKNICTAILLTLLLSYSTSCSKSGSSGESALSNSSILELPLLQEIPAGTLGFLAWNYDSPNFSDYVKMYKETFSAKSGSLIDQLRALAEGNADLKPLADMSQWFIDEKFIETDLSKPQPLKNGVAFFELSTETSKPGAGIYITSKDGFDLKQKLDALKTKLGEQNLKTAALQVSGSEGLAGVGAYTIEVKASEDVPVKNLYVIADSNKAAITTSQPLSEKIFLTAPTEKPALLSSENFSTVSKRASLSGSEITIAYADIEKALERFKHLMAAKKDDKTSGMPDTADIPVEGMLFSGNIQDASLWTSAYVTLDESKGNVKQYTNQLSNDQDFIPTTIDDKSVLSLGLAKNLIQVAKTVLLMSGELQTTPDVQAKLALLDKIDYLRIGLTQGDPGSLFPGLYIHVKSEDSGKLTETLKTMMSAMIQSGQAPLTPWREKDIAETKTAYSLSPLGIGAYVTNKDDSLFVASSESAISTLLKGKNEDNIDSSFGAASQKALKAEKPVFISHFNGEKMAELIGMAQGNLAIFTGGKNPVDPEQIEQIKSMGNVLWTLAFQDNAIIFHGIQRPVQKATAAS